MHRVLAYIDANIAEPLDLETLAGVAAFSAFHFHRLFAAWTGERLGEYVRRRRLELGASRLAAQPALEVFDVAMGVGFGSAEAFSRAFKARFGRAPSVWRQEALAREPDRKSGQAKRYLDLANSNVDQTGSADPVQDGGSRQSAAEEPVKARLETLQATPIAYLRYTGPYGAAVETFWKETVQPWMVANGLQDAARYGISHDDPSVTAPERCRYDACVVVPPGAVLTGGAHRTTLPGGQYAVVDFRGTGGDIGDAWSSLLRDWLPESDLQLDGRPCFEYYPEDAVYDERTGVFECRICVPVAPL